MGKEGHKDSYWPQYTYSALRTASGGRAVLRASGDKASQRWRRQKESTYQFVQVFLRTALGI